LERTKSPEAAKDLKDTISFAAFIVSENNVQNIYSYLTTKGRLASNMLH